MNKRIVHLLIVYAFVKENDAASLSEDGKLDFIGLATKYGHRPMEYAVTTEDGYILKLFRLPGVSSTPVLLMHGILDSADTWVLRGNTSLAITLANLGYDVWTGNCRGNKYGLSHTRLNPKADEFWNFTFHEFGYYDLPAIIDTVLLNTNSKRLNAIGHSQGNTIFYVLGSTRPAYNGKVNVLVALAPVCFLNNITPPLKYVIDVAPLLNEVLNLLNTQEVLGNRSAAVTAWRTFCPKPIIGYASCILGILFPIAGYDVEELEEDFIPTMVGHFPSSTAKKDLYHFVQVSRSRKFAQYDYGTEINLARYNSPEPPEYDSAAVTMKVALLVGSNDKLATVEDAAILKEKLPNSQHQLLPRRDMNHVDFVWGQHMTDYLYPYIFNVLRSD